MSSEKSVIKREGMKKSIPGRPSPICLVLAVDRLWRSSCTCNMAISCNFIILRFGHEHGLEKKCIVMAKVVLQVPTIIQYYDTYRVYGLHCVIKLSTLYPKHIFEFCVWEMKLDHWIINLSKTVF